MAGDEKRGRATTAAVRGGDGEAGGEGVGRVEGGTEAKKGDLKNRK